MKLRLYESRKEMLIGSIDIGENSLSNETHAAFIPAFQGRNETPYILLNEEDANDIVISHECLHATFDYIRRRDGFINLGHECDDYEELICHIHSDLFKKISDLVNGEIK